MLPHSKLIMMKIMIKATVEQNLLVNAYKVSSFSSGSCIDPFHIPLRLSACGAAEVLNDPALVIVKLFSGRMIHCSYVKLLAGSMTQCLHLIPTSPDSFTYLYHSSTHICRDNTSFTYKVR